MVKNKKIIRMKIIKDALKRLRYRQIKEGFYFNIDLDAYKTIENNDEKRQVKEDIKALEKNCTVCQLGNLFLSYISILNKVQYEEFKKTDRPDERLGEYFTEKQLYLIETYFEYNWQELSSKERAKRILKNMLENEGVFRPK